MLAVLSNGNASLVHLHCIFPKDPCICHLMHDWLHPTCTHVSMNTSKPGYQMLQNFSISPPEIQHTGTILLS